MGVGQTFQRMLGYVMKDSGETHFKNQRNGVTDEEIQLGIEEHRSLKLSYMDEKLVLTKSAVTALEERFK